MKQDKRRGLTRIALALALAGYCVAPVALAEDSAWVDSGETNIFQGTIPWLYSEGGSATTDADRVTLTSDLKGARPQGSETDKRLYSGDKLTVSWEIGDTEATWILGDWAITRKLSILSAGGATRMRRGGIQKSWQRR